MKKKISSALIMLLVLSMVSGANAAAGSSSFTHPELGEFLTIQFTNGVPSFSIYGFTYYEVVDPLTPYRGMNVNAMDLVHKGMPALEDSLNKLLDSVEGLTGDEVPFDFVYAGMLDEYTEALESLPREERVKALRLLGGFDGKKGYKKLKNIAGFEDVDVAYLEESHVEFTVRVGNKTYPYRVLMFHFSQEDWVEYNERYCYLKVGEAWKLARITKEYTDDYSARGSYIHGLSGSDPMMMEEVNFEVMRGSGFGMARADVEALENVKAQDGSITVDDTTVFRLPAKAEYVFKSGKLTHLEYTLRNVQSYYAAFISLYTRYSDPTTINENSDVVWSLNDRTITLNFNDTEPTIVIAPY